MALKDIVACYVDRHYPCDEAAFDLAVSAFHSHANCWEDDWRKQTKSRHKVVFSKGSPVAFTFDYDGPAVEVQVVFSFDPVNEVMRLAVGNWGFPFEPLLAKKRYLALLESLDAFVRTNMAWDFVEQA